MHAKDEQNWPNVVHKRTIIFFLALPGTVIQRAKDPKPELEQDILNTHFFKIMARKGGVRLQC